MVKVFSSTEQVIQDNIDTLASTVSGLNLADLGDTSISLPLAEHALVRNVGNTAWINDKVNLDTQVKNKTTARVYYDFKGFVDAPLPLVYDNMDPAYPPTGEHLVSSIYINRTAKIIYFSNLCNPAQTDRGTPLNLAEGSNAMSAYIIGLVGNWVPPQVGGANYVRPPLIKFTGALGASVSDDPARQIVFRPSNNVGGSPGMPTSGNTANAHYGGIVMDDTSWCWFRYDSSNFDLQIQSDISTTYTRWWTSSDTHESYPVLYKLEDSGNVSLTSVSNNDMLIYNSGNWVNTTTVRPRGMMAYTSRNSVAELGGVSAVLNTPFKVGGSPGIPWSLFNTVGFSEPVNGRFQYDGLESFTAQITVCGTLSLADNDRAFEILVRNLNGTVELENSRTVANSKNAISKSDDFSKTFLFDVTTGMNFEVWASAIDSATSVTFREMNLSIIKIS